MSLTRSSNYYTFGMRTENRSLPYQQNVKAPLNKILSGAETQTLQSTKAIQGFTGIVMVSKPTPCQFSQFQVLSILPIISNSWTPVVSTT